MGQPKQKARMHAFPWMLMGESEICSMPKAEAPRKLCHSDTSVALPSFHHCSCMLPCIIDACLYACEHCPLLQLGTDLLLMGPRSPHQPIMWPISAKHNPCSCSCQEQRQHSVQTLQQRLCTYWTLAETLPQEEEQQSQVCRIRQCSAATSGVAS